MTNKSNVTPMNSAKAGAGKTKAAASAARKDPTIASQAVKPAVENAEASAAAVSGQAKADAPSAAVNVTPAAGGVPEASEANSGSTSILPQAEKASMMESELFLVPWQVVAIGQIVLVADNSDGEFEGWWPARLIASAGDDFVYEWVDYEVMGTFHVNYKDIALLFPAFAR